MKRLIAAMELPGFSWPVCPGSGVGKPGKETYEPCDDGWTSSALEGGSIAMCQKKISNIEAKELRRQAGVGLGGGQYMLQSGGMLIEQRIGNDRYTDVEYYLLTKRKKRADPWYFDFRNSDGVTTRKWFNLNQ
nr:hypothetical protein [Ochrobactrum sp. LM19]